MNASTDRQASDVANEAEAYEIGNTVGSSLNGDGDEVVQFEADQFIADQFCMVSRSKKKRPKDIVGGTAEAGVLQERIGFRSGLSSSTMDDNRDARECGAIEDNKRRMPDISQKPSQYEPGTLPMDSAAVKLKELDTLLKEGFEAYDSGHYGPAADKYKMAWEMITDATLELRPRVVEHVVCYMLGLSLLETNLPNNILKAVELLIALEKRSSAIFPAVYYALSLAHHKHYRFASALEAIEKGLAILEGDVNLTEHTIPGSNDTLKESTKDGLSLSLASMKNECSKWHPPDAVCRMSECLPSSQWYGPDRNIYFGDPTYNGMIILTCSNARNPCTIKFHRACWKLKRDQLSAPKKSSDKEIIDASYECFTPNCESSQGCHSLITTIDVHGDDGKFKTRVGGPLNPVVWGKRKPQPKGAVPKQQLKPRRPVETIRRPLATASPRPSSKKAVTENRAEREWRLAKLVNLRRNNFGIKPDCEWRPDREMYGNPQMMEIGDFLGGPIFENDDEKMAAIKSFVFSYFYEFIKENGCVKRNEISQKWDEHEFIFDNYSNVLHAETDICEFLLQSFKLVALGDYIGIAEKLPQLYTVVKNEVCSCLKFLLADSLQCQTAVVQDDALNMVFGDYEEKKTKPPTAVVGKETKSDTARHPAKIQQVDGTPPLPIDHCEILSTLVPNTSQYGGDTIDLDTFHRPENDVVCQKTITQEGSPFEVDLPVIEDARLKSEDSVWLGGVGDPIDRNQRPYNNICGRDTGPNGAQVDSKLVSNPKEKNDGVVERDVALIEGTSHLVDDQPHDLKTTDHSLLREKVSNEKTDTQDSDLADYKSVDSEDCKAGMNGDTMEIIPELCGSAPELKLICIDNDYSENRAETGNEAPPSVNTNATLAEHPKTSDEKHPDCSVSTGTTSMESEGQTVTIPTSQGPNIMAESNVQKIESDLASMAKTVAQLKSVLEQNQTRSENHAQMLQQEFINHQKVSQERMSELVKDFNRLEARCAQLESEKLQITCEYQECQRDLRRTNDDNISLKLKTTELMWKYDKLGKEKTDLEHNLNLSRREKSTIENKLETLQRERDKMDKKLQKYQARLKDKSCADAGIMNCQQKEQRESEQRLLAATRLSDRKSKLQSLAHEFDLNKYALEKASEKYHDHINMLTDVSKLVTLVTGQRFAVTEAQVAWRETDYNLRCTIARYKENYADLKALLESDNEIDNLDDIKLPFLNIVFPQLPNLTELYYTGKISLAIPHQMPILPTPWAIPGVHQHQNSCYSVPVASASYPGKNFEPGVNVNIPAGPVVLTNHSPQNLPPINNTDCTSQRSQVIDEMDCQRVQNTVQRGAGITTVGGPPVRSENSVNTVARQNFTSQDTEEYVERALQASYCTTAVGTNPPKAAPPTPVIRRPTPSKKIGKDLLVQELKKKFVGVPELDLLHSIEDVRKLHNDSLSGMRVEDIIRESEPYVQQRQEKHMANYSQTWQTLPPERSFVPPNKANQRKIPTSTALGQQKRVPSVVQEQPNTQGNSSSTATPVVPAALKKQAWRPVASPFVDWKKNEEDSECTICLDALDGSMSVCNKRVPMYILPCQHSFHTTCIKQWLSENSVCPNCRKHCTMDDEFPPLPS